jgi:hypothetical protein
LADEHLSLEDLADWAIARQGHAGFLFFLALCLGVSTGLFIALFQVEAWKEALLIWGYENGHSGVIIAVAEGSWWRSTWRQWASLGVAGTAVLLLGWFLLNFSVARKMGRVRGLRSAVAAERAKRRENAFILAGCLVALLLAPFAIAMAASQSRYDDDDE